MEEFMQLACMVYGNFRISCIDGTEILGSVHVPPVNKSTVDQNIDSVDLLSLISEEQIKLLIPAIGDQIRFKQAVKRINSNPCIDNNQQYHNENELVVSNKRKQAIFENNPISIDETEPESKFKKIDGSTPILLVVDSQAPGPSNSGTETGIASASTVTDLRNSDCGQNSSFLSVAQEIHDFNLSAILEGDVIERAILTKHNTNVPVTNRDRNSLCEIVISYFLNKSVKLNNDFLSRIADEITKIMPTEKKTTYFVSPIKKISSRFNKPEVARGKLVDKHRNKLTALRRTIEFPPVPSNYNTEPTSNEPSQSAKDSQIWLLHNRETVEDVLQHWKNAYEIRKFCNNKNATIESFLNEWPILNEQIAIELVSYDFKQMFQLELTAIDLENAFETFFDSVIHKRRSSLNATDETFIQLLAGNITTDSKNAIKLYLLFSLVPVKGRTRIGQKHWKPSRTESRDGFFLHVKVPGDIEKAKQEKIDSNYCRVQIVVKLALVQYTHLQRYTITIAMVKTRNQSTIYDHRCSDCFKAKIHSREDRTIEIQRTDEASTWFMANNLKELKNQRKILKGMITRIQNSISEQDGIQELEMRLNNLTDNLQKYNDVQAQIEVLQLEDISKDEETWDVENDRERTVTTPFVPTDLCSGGDGVYKKDGLLPPSLGRQVLQEDSWGGKIWHGGSSRFRDAPLSASWDESGGVEA
ncbi:hypothetical protein Zmor_018899 [Zophobas morio]|uniref:Uncharacterized protein n=1 Tax=Zophobas morio TaxID=2755281 RepID=A0AA38I8A2_9CUCU|nr:hypothetical protein Zmor_018899 [Zophobas morio]